MANYIDRQTAIYTFYAFAPGIPWDTLDKIFNEIPSADVVEVVRCKDCKHYDLAKNGVNGVCNRQYGSFNAFDFCSYGERREEHD